MMKHGFAPALPALLLAGSLALPAQAQTYPAKTITAVVPYAAGGLTDQLARDVAAQLSKTLKQSVVIENRPGGAAQIAINYVKQAPADGYTLFFGDVPSLATNLGLFPHLSYDPRKDLQPVTQLVVSPGLLVVPPNSPYKTMADLVQAARTHPKGISYASQGVGSGGHLFGTLLQKAVGMPMVHTAYKGSSPGLADLMGGQVDFMYDAIPTAGAFVRGGKLRALAVGADERVPMFPNVPTLKELGYEKIVPTFWWGVAVKAGTPAPVVDLLSKAIAAAIREPAVAKRFTDQGVIIVTSTPNQFQGYINAEIGRWTKVMHEAGMSAE